MKNRLKMAKWSAILALVVALTAICFTLTACDPGSYQFEREELDDVVSVELINYDNPKQKEFSSWVPDHSADLKPFDNSKVTVLETLADDKTADFLDELCEIPFLYLYYSYDSPKGICIKLSRSNGDYIIIWSDYVGEFSSDGEVKWFCGCFSGLSVYKDFVNGYFETQI